MFYGFNVELNEMDFEDLKNIYLLIKIIVKIFMIIHTIKDLKNIRK